MQALVKKPHIRLSLHDEQAEEVIAWIQKKYKVDVLTDDSDDELVPIESTAYWEEMQKNRIGNLLIGARLKAGLTQSQLAKKIGVRQNMISDYERGKRRLSQSMAKRIAKIIHIKVDRIS